MGSVVPKKKVLTFKDSFLVRQFGCFQKMGENLQNGWFIMENTIKMDDLGGKPTIFGNIHLGKKWTSRDA